MGLTRQWRIPGGHGLSAGLMALSLVLHWDAVYCITVSAPEEVKAVRGETVTLSCYFSSTSRTTSLISINWSFRPQSGGLDHTFFHFSSKPYPPEEGQFKGRVLWAGALSQGDASIQLLNASLLDNGTFTCGVRNPPDVYGSPAQTTLTVTPKMVGVCFSDVAVLLLFILVPSGLIALMLLGWILCPCCASTRKTSSHSPIEVTDGEEYGYKQPSPKQKALTCCEVYLLDSEDEEYYLHHEKYQLEPVAETQC
ncbi:myelin protein zero-like protein 3 [Hoplias malabaricus]|uniref:myelin protein zero-like protein 3 n=1 Tax=Hoplias malabaricus TaxID=27720 RepID=UPI0034633E3F